MTEKKKTQLKADLILISMTLCWSLSYHAVDVCVKETGIAGLTGIRFILAFIITAAIFHAKLRELTGKTVLYGLFIGIFLAACYQTATMSIEYTLYTNAAFLCTLSMMIVPIIEFVLYKKKPPKKILISLAIAFAGIVLLTRGTGFEFGSKNALGDICGLLSSFFYAFEIVVMEQAVKKHHLDPLGLGICSIGWTGIIMTVISLAINDISLPHSGKALIAIAFLVIFCSAYPFIMQPIAQRHTETSHVGIILTLEPVFASLFALFLDGIVPTKMQFAGQFLMFVSMIFLEVDFPIKKKTQADDV